MSASGFAIFCLVGFLLPVPLLVWLDRPRKPAPKSAANVAAALVALALAIAPAARADVFPRFPRGWSQSGQPKEDWQRGRLLVGGGLGIANSFPSEWRPALGWSMAMLHPVQPWCDVSVGFDGFTLGFDSSKLLAGGATNIRGGPAWFSNVALGVHLHPARLGWRWYGVAELALPDVSRPSVSYSDASGSHTREGIEIFGLDPGFVVGAGYERVQVSKIGGALEARLVVAPGTTEPAQILSVFRATLAIPMPF
jgi:hypothetical protein